MVPISFVMKRRTKGTIFAVNEKLKDVDVEELISEIFVHTDNLVALEMIKRIEKQLILSKIHPKKFESGLHVFFKDTSKWIKENNLVKEFFEFIHFMYMNFYIDRSKMPPAADAYFDMLSQLHAYLEPNKLVYGVTDKGELLIREEVIPYLDFPYMEMEFKGVKLTKQNADVYFKKYGFTSDQELNYALARHEQILTQMVINMGYFIDNVTKDTIFPEKYFLPARGADLPRQWKETHFYKEQLRNRKYLLSARGAYAKIRNAKDVKEVYLCEKIYGDRVYMLYKVKLDDGYLCGYYDLVTEMFYSVWRDTENGGSDRFHKPLENFILELYTYLTTDVDVDTKRSYALKEVEQIEKINVFNIDQPVVEFKMWSHKTPKGERLVNYDRSKFIAVPKDIEHYIRKLPPGSRASTEAINRARQLGYIIGNDETFVRPHKKKVLRKEG